MGVVNMCSHDKVLVLGNDTRAFLSVVRSLGRYGLEVHAGWCSPDGIAAQSRYLHKIHHIPEYDPLSNEWKDQLIKLLSQERYSLVIPCNDPSIIPLDKNRELIKEYTRVYLLDELPFSITQNKGKTTSLARSLGINVPQEKAFASPFDIDAITSEFQFQFIITFKSFITFS